REYQTEASVGSSLRKLSFTSCSWWAIVASFPLLIPLSGGMSSEETYCSRRRCGCCLGEESLGRLLGRNANTGQALGLPLGEVRDLFRLFGRSQPTWKV